MLEDLVTAIETVQGRIREHGGSLRENEYRTRIALIDPILNALGWEVSDPGAVTIEDRYSGGNTPDYALLARNGGGPLAFVEAKRLGTSLDAHEDQVFKYTWDRKISYAGLTDGDRWVFRDVAAEFFHREGLLLDITISKEKAEKLALQLLLLWRPTLGIRDYVNANEPVLGGPEVVDPPIKTSKLSKAKPPTTSSGWIPLSEYTPGKGDPLPLVRFPGGNEKLLQKWNELPVEIAEWLIRDGLLTEGVCPIKGGPRRYLVHREARHVNGEEFKNGHILSNGLSIETNYNRANHVKNVKFLLKYFDKDLESVFVKHG